MLFARSRLNVLFSKFLRAQKRVRISFRPKVLLSVVFALKKDRRLSFRRSSNVMREKEEEHTRARREKIRICAIVPLSAMISSSSSESTSIVAVIMWSESSNRGVRVFLFVSLFSSAEERFLRRPVSLFGCLGYQNSFWEFFSLSSLAFLFSCFVSFVINSKHTQTKHR